MTFEDGSQSARYFGEGFRELSVATAPAAVPVVAGAGASEADPTLSLGKQTPPPNLDLVFDDPADGEPGRDRLIIHGVWELLLAVALAGAGYLLYQADSSAFSGGGVRELLLATTILGLIAAGSAVALRSGAPNLAVGGVAVAVSIYYGQHAGSGPQSTIFAILGLCVAIGLVQALVVVGLHVPAWAASLAVLLGLMGWLSQQSVVSINGGYKPGPDAYLWFAGFCVISLAGALLGLVPNLRRGLARFRPVADPARRRGPLAGLIVVGTTVVSTMLAGAAGILSALVAGRAQPTGALELSALALAAALVGGTSAFGRRGGILGTIFAAGLITIALAYAVATNRNWPEAAFAAVAIAVGLAVTRLIERFGRPSSVQRRGLDDDWVPKVHALTPAGHSWQPAPAATPSGSMWASDDAWGSIESR